MKEEVTRDEKTGICDWKEADFPNYTHTQNNNFDNNKQKSWRGKTLCSLVAPVTSLSLSDWLRWENLLIQPWRAKLNEASSQQPFPAW